MCRTRTSSSSLNDRSAASFAAAALGLGLALTGFSADFAFGQAPGKKAETAPIFDLPKPRKPAPIYTKTPTTPLEFWDAADYLLRTGQPADAVPYLRQFLQSNPDDATLLAVRDHYGAGSFLRLQDHPETRAMAEPLVTKLAEASRRTSTNPERISRHIAALTKTKEEQDYAVEQLRQAGAYAVPPIMRELSKQGISPENHALLVRNMGRLDRSATPALIAALDAKSSLASDAAVALGGIGDPRAVPALTALIATAEPGSAAAAAASRSIEQITKRPFAAQPKSPVRLLADEARRYHTHAIKFPGDSMTIWDWDANVETPAPRTVSRSGAFLK